MQDGQQSITVEREGLMNWSWRAWGVLRRPQHLGAIILLPTGQRACVDLGTALTRRGAERKARRALKRWT